jgi:hypothetical protein
MSIIFHYNGNTEEERLHYKILEMRTEMQRMTAALAQLQVSAKGKDSNSLNNSLAAVNGWFTSMVESYFAVLYLVGGTQYRATLIRKLIADIQSYGQ